MTFDLLAIFPHVQQLGVGPEVSNNMGAPANCVGGSEQQCIPQGCGPQCGGGAVSVPHPATWYAGGEHTTALRGAEFYNNTLAPNNCVGGSETSCPASNLQPPPPPDSWYANGAGHTQSLGVGPEVSNNMGAPANCVGGSEQQCIPQGCGPQCGGGAVTVPHPATWYAGGEHTTALRGAEFYNNTLAPNNCVGGSETSCPASNLQPPPPPDSWYARAEPPAVQAQLAAPATGVGAEAPGNTVKGQPGHFVLMGHAMFLAAAQGLAKMDFSGFSEDAAANAEACSGLSGFILRNHVVPAAK